MWEHVLIRLLHMGTSNKQIMIIVYGFAESGWFKSFFYHYLDLGYPWKIGIQTKSGQKHVFRGDIPWNLGLI